MGKRWIGAAQASGTWFDHRRYGRRPIGGAAGIGGRPGGAVLRPGAELGRSTRAVPAQATNACGGSGADRRLQHRARIRRRMPRRQPPRTPPRPKCPRRAPMWSPAPAFLQGFEPSSALHDLRLQECHLRRRRRRRRHQGQGHDRVSKRPEAPPRSLVVQSGRAQRHLSDRHQGQIDRGAAPTACGSASTLCSWKSSTTSHSSSKASTRTASPHQRLGRRRIGGAAGRLQIGREPCRRPQSRAG